MSTEPTTTGDNETLQVECVADWLATEYGELLNPNPADDPPGYWEFQARELLAELAVLRGDDPQQAQDRKCPVDGFPMNPAKAWWWTERGATCSEACAVELIRPAPSPGAATPHGHRVELEDGTMTGYQMPTPQPPAETRQEDERRCGCGLRVCSCRSDWGPAPSCANWTGKCRTCGPWDLCTCTPGDPNDLCTCTPGDPNSACPLAGHRMVADLLATRPPADTDPPALTTTHLYALGVNR